MNYAERLEIPGKVEGDMFLLNPPMQPKKEIGDYVESQGILVPQRFANLQEALASGKPFIIRSEHPQDYAGVSGMGHSMRVTERDRQKGKEELLKFGSKIDWDQVFDQDRIDAGQKSGLERLLAGSIENLSQQELEARLTQFSKIQSECYCRHARFSLADFEAHKRYSYWEFIPGARQVVVADSALVNRHHIFSYSPKRKVDDGNNPYVYAVLEKGKVIQQYSPDTLKSELTLADLSQSVEFYETVRRLPAFSSKNVPLVEMVYHQGKHYFLQSHRTTDVQHADFSLEKKSLATGEVEAGYVRGCTDENGLIVETSFWPPFNDEYDFILNSDPEDASFDFHFDRVYSELKMRVRKAQFILERDLDWFLLTTYDHLQKTKLFKPPITVMISHDQQEALVPELENVKTPRGHSTFRVKFHIVSDGRRAIVKRVD